MTDERKIYRMTQLAIFEEHHKEQLRGVQKYFRGDYIGRNMIKNAIRGTLAFLLVLAGWGLYNAETFLVDITQIDVLALGTRILFLYVACMCAFLVLTYAIWAVRYVRAAEDLYHYRELLQALGRMYSNDGE